jgi:hypothetical protein
MFLLVESLLCVCPSPKNRKDEVQQKHRCVLTDGELRLNFYIDMERIVYQVNKKFS